MVGSGLTGTVVSWEVPEGMTIRGGGVPTIVGEFGVSSLDETILGDTPSRFEIVGNGQYIASADRKVEIAELPTRLGIC